MWIQIQFPQNFSLSVNHVLCFLEDEMKTRLVCSAPIPDCLSLPSSRSSSTSSQSLQGGSKLEDEEKEEKNDEKSAENQICGKNCWRVFKYDFTGAMIT